MQNFNAPQPHDCQFVPIRGEIKTPHEDFDFAAVSAQLGEPAEIEVSVSDHEALVIALRRIIRWQVAPVDRRSADWESGVARRTMMLAHALGVLDGNPSLREIAERTGADKMKLSAISIAARREFGIPTPAKTGGRRKSQNENGPAGFLQPSRRFNAPYPSHNCIKEAQ